MRKTLDVPQATWDQYTLQYGNIECNLLTGEMEIDGKRKVIDADLFPRLASLILNQDRIVPYKEISTVADDHLVEDTDTDDCLRFQMIRLSKQIGSEVKVIELMDKGFKIKGGSNRRRYWPAVIHNDDISLNLLSRHLRRRGQLAKLTRQEAKLVILLLANPDQSQNYDPAITARVNQKLGAPDLIVGVGRRRGRYVFVGSNICERPKPRATLAKAVKVAAL